MDKLLLVFTILLSCVLSGCIPFNEDDWPNRDRESSSYLDYIKAREQAYEDALRLRDSFHYNQERYLGPEDDDDESDDYDDEDSNGRRSSDAEENDELGRRDRAKGRRNSKRIERLKQEINDRNSPNHIANDKQKNAQGVSAEDKISIKKRKDYINLSKKKKVKSKKKANKKDSLRTDIKSSKDETRKDENYEAKENTANRKDEIEKTTKVHATLNEASELLSYTDSRKHNDIVDNKGEESDDPGQSSSVNNSATKPPPVPPPQKISSKKNTKKLDKALFIVVVAACSVAGVAGLILAGYCWYRLRNEQEDVPEEDTKKYVKKKKKNRKPELTNDEKLAKSAEVFHYMHTKKQLAAMEKSGTDKKASVVDDSDSSEEESDNTVYECPGLAPPGDMKVINPLFSDTEREHSDVRSDGSHVSSPTRELSPPKKEQKEDLSSK
ncbi:uncharacterized protein LOC135693116 [Rhopilema esculentum]|uniref:uncharacterized protein LOC135693116 n=1 Tax=Rhopilema esculentum TaxID=499914 RepID=UPI0031E1C7B2|eukprot:gene10951-19786_t